MNAVLDHPTAHTETTREVASEVVDRAEIKNGKPLVKYSRTEAALADLRARHAGATFDLKTTKGDQAARAARLELVTLRTSLERQRKDFKAPLLAYGKMIDSEAVRITAEIEALEKPIDEQIRADEARRAAEKAERERIEAERVAAHREFIRTFGTWAEYCRKPDMTAARILDGINALSLVTIGPEREEFEEPAKLAKAQALIAMGEAHAQAVAREAEAARQEAIRIENERQAEVNAREAARIAAEAAEIGRQQAEQAAELKRQADELAAQRAESERLEREAEARRQAHREAEEREARQRERDAFIAANPPAPLQQTAADPAPDTTTASPIVGSMGAGQAADAAPVEEPAPSPWTVLQDLAAEARASRFQSEPKMGRAWWVRFYALADAACNVE